MGAIKRRTVRIGTRKSRLALVQTNMVAEAIEAACPEVKCELVPLMTKGDKILKTSLVAFGGKGAFVEEFEQSILNGDIDLAVHSAKDMPMDLSDGLCIGAVLKREDPRDVFVTVKGRTPERSPRIIGTGSPRRQVQIMEHGDVECRLLRGNVDTRLEKLYQGEYDGIILAAAGLNRLGLFNDPRFSFEFLEPEMFIPAGGQGIIAVEAKKGSEVLKILKKLNDKEAERALFAERKVLRLLGAGCTAAVGVYAKEENGTFWMGLMRETKNGLIRRKISGAPEDSMKLAELLVKKGTEGELPAGKAYLVGAGPGNGGLITVKGQQILKAAEVLVYDRLGSEELLTLVPEDCERIYVGKEAGHHIKKQSEINRILVEKALEGKRVIRLKGGDPFVFGRGGEEIQALTEAGIPYEVIPGVTSAIGALEAAGIPVTHRNIARDFHVFTGHISHEGGEGLSGDYSLYAKLPGTLIFLMGLSNLEEIVKRLIDGGKDGETPAAVVTDGTLSRMRVVRASLKDLPEAVRKAGLTPPGIIAVGEVCAFHFTSMVPGVLTGITVGVTGTEAVRGRIISRLSDEGAKTVRAGESLVVRESMERLDQAFADLSRYRWVIFTSRNAVRIFFDRMREKHVDIRKLGGLKFAVVGRGTGEYLESVGITPDFIPEEYTTKALADGLVKYLKENGETFGAKTAAANIAYSISSSENVCPCAESGKFLIPRAKQGSKVLTETLAEQGYAFDDIPIYDILVEQTELARLKTADYITFESGSGVRGFFAGREAEAASLFETVRPVCIGKVTAAVLAEYGVKNALTASDYTADGILEVLLADRNEIAR